MKKFLYAVFLLFIFSCAMPDSNNGQDGAEGVSGTDGTDGTDATTDVATNYNLLGKFQKGRCLTGGEVFVWPLIDGTLTQSGAHFVGFTENDGAYSIRAQIKEQYVLVYAKLNCDDEANGGTSYQELYGIRKTADELSNVNVLTKISKPVIEHLFDTKFGTVSECVAEAERQVIEYLAMPESGKFSGMSLEKGTQSDAVLALTSAMVLYDRTEPEQGDFMSDISTGIIRVDPILKSEISGYYDALPLLTIKNNLESSYNSINRAIITPPFWRLSAPDYYADLLERTQIVQGSFNLEDTGNCSMDMGYKRYAIPHIFEPWIETSKYLATNFNLENVSIWSRGVHGGGYDAPGIKLLDIPRLKENLLDSNLNFQGILGNHSLKSGDEIYFVIESETAFVLSVGCEGGFLPWGRKLASNNGGLTYIGWDNSTTFFRKSGLKLIGVN